MGTGSNIAKYRKAVATIAANCVGINVRSLLHSKPKLFTQDKVRELAGTSPEYQRHVIDRALTQDSRPFRMIAATLHIYDTVAFREVTSRLHRALGLVRKESAFLMKAVASGTEPDRLADRLLTLDLIVEQATRLQNLIGNIPTIQGEGKAPRKNSKSQSKSSINDQLQAACGLGLIAKNVRNVAALQSAHRPTDEEKELALRLTKDALELARAAYSATRRKFGPADAACRVRTSNKPTRRVITHAEPNGDAIAAAWLVERFVFAGESVEVLFIPRERVCGAYRVGDCLVDVGNTHDAKNMFFDHKPPAYHNRHNSCAARLVWEHLVKLGRPVKHLLHLIDVVFAGDSVRERASFKEQYAESKRNGFHKALADAKAKHSTDADVYRTVRRWLDACHRKSVTTRS
jgi:hypothetical protein